MVREKIPTARNRCGTQGLCRIQRKKQALGHEYRPRASTCQLPSKGESVGTSKENRQADVHYEQSLPNILYAIEHK